MLSGVNGVALAGLGPSGSESELGVTFGETEPMAAELLLLALNTNKMTTATMITRNAIPPTTPPTTAPVMDCEKRQEPKKNRISVA
jgi:hypothetical protein